MHWSIDAVSVNLDLDADLDELPPGFGASLRRRVQGKLTHVKTGVSWDFAKGEAVHFQLTEE